MFSYIGRTLHILCIVNNTDNFVVHLWFRAKLTVISIMCHRWRCYSSAHRHWCIRERERVHQYYQGRCLVTFPPQTLSGNNMMTSSNENIFALLAICARNSPVPTQRPVTHSFDVNFDLRPNKRLSKQSWGWWFETPSCSLWRHRNELHLFKDQCCRGWSN